MGYNPAAAARWRDPSGHRIEATQPAVMDNLGQVLGLRDLVALFEPARAAAARAVRSERAAARTARAVSLVAFILFRSCRRSALFIR